jgi:hypothetical protein
MIPKVGLNFPVVFTSTNFFDIFNNKAYNENIPIEIVAMTLQ